MGRNWLISSRKILKKIFVTKSVIILPKFNRKLAENRPIVGPKKPAGLSGFGNRASGGLGPPKNGFGRAGFGLSPRPDPSLQSQTEPWLWRICPRAGFSHSPKIGLRARSGFSPLNLSFKKILFPVPKIHLSWNRLGQNIWI